MSVGKGKLHVSGGVDVWVTALRFILPRFILFLIICQLGEAVDFNHIFLSYDNVIKPVSKKNGLQCQGACQKWAHFKCLNYTPGKIQDIKAGVIKITCPCPDCNTSLPKEILTDPPYTCTNTQCPANKLPASNSECPTTCPTSPCESPESRSPCPPPRSPCPPPKPPCPPPRSPCPPPRSPCPPPRSPCPPPRSPCPPPRSPCSRPRSPCPPPRTPSPPRKLPQRARSRAPRSPSLSRSPSPKPKLPPCLPPSPYPSKNGSFPCPPSCPPNCPSYQNKNTKKSFSPKQSQSCSDISNESSSSAKPYDKMRSISSDSKLPSAGVDPKTLFSAIEGLCNTVGQLSNQLRNLMCKIQAGYGP